MGSYLFADASLSWFPPLIFTLLNEAGFSERVGLASITFFFLASLIPYFKMGSYDECVKRANRLVVAPAEILEAIAEEEGGESSVPIPAGAITSGMRIKKN